MLRGATLYSARLQPSPMNPPPAPIDASPTSGPGHPSHPSQEWQRLGDGWALRLAGDWRGAAAAGLSLPPPAVAQATGAALTVDGQALTAWDGGLTAALRERLAPLARLGMAMHLDALPQDVRGVLALALPQPGDVATARVRPPGAIERLGLQVQRSGTEALRTIAFFGEVMLGTLRLLRGKSAMRWADFWQQVDQTGPLSIPIVSLTCFLIGLMLAYMGGAQLDKLGAQAYIADIVTVGMVRELAGLMTGMILAGRVGAAFAAQLATMKAGEEIDALRVLGVDPIDYLVMPRLLALVLVAPLVMAYASLVGVLAGLIPAVLAYGLPAAEYLHKCLNALTWTHLWIGVAKCTLYAALLALAGCREGLHAGRDAQAVGQATTRAVVKGLVWIIAAASITTILLQSLGF
jgi:phospholipid/cholesterol/gamma-HCH transport system permease protein